jgi:hypothetical protein
MSPVTSGLGRKHFMPASKGGKCRVVFTEVALPPRDHAFFGVWASPRTFFWRHSFAGDAYPPEKEQTDAHTASQQIRAPAFGSLQTLGGPPCLDLAVVP